jgi:AraC family L-rhamnose operon transcriptional activator RhaR
VDRLRRRDVFPADGFPVAGEVVGLDAPVEGHTHDFLEVAVLLEGTVTHLTATGRQVLAAGAVTAVRPGQWHGYAEPGRALIGNLYLGEELLHRELRWLLDVGDLSRFLLRGGLSTGRLDAAARSGVRGRLVELAGVRARPGTAAAVRAVGLATTVLAELARVRLAGAPTPAFSPAVRRTVLLLGREPQRPWTMGELAAEVGHSVSHLHREFRSQLGATPMAWLARTRAEVAASLLVQTERPVAWVGQQVGWPDPNYFSRCFRRAHGMSPSAYRARHSASGG